MEIFQPSTAVFFYLDKSYLKYFNIIDITPTVQCWCAFLRTGYFTISVALDGVAQMASISGWSKSKPSRERFGLSYHTGPIVP